MKKYLLLIVLWGVALFLYPQKSSTAGQAYPEDYLKVMDELQQSMRYEELIQFIDSLPTNDAVTLQTLAGAQISLGLWKDAFSTMESAAAVFPQDVNMLGNFADMALSVGNSDLALTLLNKATNSSEQPLMMNKKAEILYSKKRFKESLSVADSILHHYPISSVIRLKARNLAALNELAESQKLLENQYSKDKNDYLTFRQLSGFYMAIDSIEKLIIVTDKYLKKDSLNIEILNLNSKANYLNNNFTKAASGYRKLIDLGAKPTYDQCFFTAMSFYRANDTLIYDAYNYMQKADTLSEGDRYPLKYYLGQMAEKMGKIPEAVKYYKQASDIVNPDSIQLAQIFNKLGKMQMLDKKPLEAIASHQTVLKFNADDTTAILSLGLAYAYLNEYEKALTYFEEIVRLLPDTVNDAYSNLASRQIKYLKEKIKNKTSQKRK